MTKPKIEILQTIRPKLADLERQRKDLFKQHEKQRIDTLSLLGLGLLILILCAAFINDFNPSIAIYGSVGLTVLAFHYLERKKAPVGNSWRQSLGYMMTKAINPQWSYSASGHLPAKRFKYLGLFPRFNHINGGGMIHGQHGDTKFSFSHLELYGKGKNKTDIFNGMLILIDFHKAVQRRTLVFPDVAQRTLGDWAGKKIQEMGWKGLELVYLEDPHFEKTFAVYSSDQIEARYILTPSMMENLLQLSKKFQNKLSFCFANGVVAIAIEDFIPFEKGLDFSIKADQTFYQFCRPIEVVTEVIDTLNLNTRIWAKA